MAHATVLVVEDDPPLRHFYRTVLSLAGYAVVEAGSGYEALRAIDNHRPDVVVLDLGLPGLSGRTVREELAAQAHTCHIPIVVVTGRSGPDTEGLDAACVLTKPVSADELITVVRQCLAARRKQD